MLEGNLRGGFGVLLGGFESFFGILHNDMGGGSAPPNPPRGGAAPPLDPPL